MASLPTEDDSSLLWLFSQPFLLERNQSIQLILSPLLTRRKEKDKEREWQEVKDRAATEAAMAALAMAATTAADTAAAATMPAQTAS